MAVMAEPEIELAMQDGVDTSPPPAFIPSAPPAMFAPAPVMRGPARADVPDRARSSIEPEQVNLPEHVTSRISRDSLPDSGRSDAPRGHARAIPRGEPDGRSAPSPARSQQGTAGSTPLEMALEGEVARVAAQGEAHHAHEAAGAPAVGRVLADPTPPTVTRPIVQAVTKHPPTTGHTFGEMLRRSLALRPR
jgi:hypothetical protein